MGLLDSLLQEIGVTMYRANHGYPSGQGGFRGNESLEDQNEVMEGELKGKVSALKSLSINIGVELEEQKKLLNSMDDGFDSASSIFTNTIGKVGKLLKSHSNYHIYYLLLFCLFVFLVLW